MTKSKYTWKVPSGKFGTIRDFTVIDQNCGFRIEFSYCRVFLYPFSTGINFPNSNFQIF